MTQVAGMDELLRNMQKLGADIPVAVDEAVADVALSVKADAVRSIQEVSGGDTVTRYSQGGDPFDHTASKPGDAPNTDNGDLARSIAMQHEKGSGVAHVSTNEKHGPPLEFGTVKMAARPFLGPALDGNRDNLLGAVKRAIQRQLPKAAV